MLTVQEMDSDSSNYETTYSQDERIERCLRNKKEKEREEALQLELEREAEFSEYYKTSKDDEDSIFSLKGLHFIRFTSKRIKFNFQACRVAHVSKRIIFYVSLRYRKGFWRLKHDSIPVNYKQKVYKLFYTNGSYRFEDENVMVAIWEIWKILVKWAKVEAKFRADKFKRYRNGDEDVYIDEDDEDLFLSDEEIEELHRKREDIWRRMLPPRTETETTRRLRVRPKRRPVVRLESSSNS